ncbi:hypothetical protein F4819DRAFT_491908 [Hypoxylon fuscum]|nr:hypothetical protein F4819DRAFT_491908 [Hypoxylon fuscum]
MNQAFSSGVTVAITTLQGPLGLLAKTGPYADRVDLKKFPFAGLPIGGACFTVFVAKSVQLLLSYGAGFGFPRRVDPALQCLIASDKRQSFHIRGDTTPKESQGTPSELKRTMVLTRLQPARPSLDPRLAPL